jgi:hypothetical protein
MSVWNAPGAKRQTKSAGTENRMNVKLLGIGSGEANGWFAITAMVILFIAVLSFLGLMGPSALRISGAAILRIYERAVSVRSQDKCGRSMILTESFLRPER